MLGPINQDNLDSYLIALAGGELDLEQTAAVWSYLCDSHRRHEAIRFLHEQQQLTLATRRAVRCETPPELRAKITSLLAANTPATPVTSSMSIPARTASSRMWKYTAACAAGLLLGIGGFALTQQLSSSPRVVPESVVAVVQHTHSQCSRLPLALHDATFAAVSGPLSSSVRASLGGERDTPDFTAAGFIFVGAGPCPFAGPDTVHLLYRVDPQVASRAVSLFVQTDRGQLPEIADNRIYRVAAAGSPYPLLAWRTGGVIYFLMADDTQTQMQILQLIRPTAESDIVTVASR